MAKRNLRQYPRRAAKLEARVEHQGGSLPGTIENIGEGGVLFVTDLLEGSVDVGARVTIRFRPEDASDDVSLPGEVLRVERDFLEGEILRTLAIRFEIPWRPR